MSRKIRFGSAVVVALLLVGVFGWAALADTSSNADDNRAMMEEKMKENQQNFITKLAANLGVDEDTLEAALEATQEEILSEQVENGTITQEQADKMSERGFSFNLGLGGPGHGGPGGPGGHGGQGGPGGPPPGENSTGSSS